MNNSRTRAEELSALSQQQDAMNNMPKDVSQRVSTCREKKVIAAHNRATNIVLPRFKEKDFVLVRSEQKKRDKLSFR